MKTDFPALPLPFPDNSWMVDKLAISGGKPIVPGQSRKTQFPAITKEDIFQMLLALKGDPEEIIKQFTEEYQKYVGANYAISTASGTSSLHLALIGAGVQPGDEVILPAFTFIATAQAVVAAKAIPIFVDIDPKTYCLDPNAAERQITSRTCAIMPVHVHGLPADVKSIQEICDHHNLKLVEDASHAHSAGIGEQMCGAMGDAAGQSLMADKNFPVGGEGGIAFFKSEEAYERVLRFLEKTGIDYRMSWIVAAFGISQLQRLPYYDAIRARNTAFLSEMLQETKLFSPPYVPEGYKHSYNMYRLAIQPETLELDDLPIYKVKGAIQDILLEEGVPAREWQNSPIPAHLPFQNRMGFGNGYPFSLSTRDNLDYDNSSYPSVLKMLESTLVICRELRVPIEYERIISYANAFKKVEKHPDKIRLLALENNYPLPYQKDSRLG